MMYRIAFVGSGNLAWHLAPELENAGHAVVAVTSRNKKNAAALVRKLYNAEVKQDYDFTDLAPDIVFVAVSDDAIQEVAKEIVMPEGGVLAHTAGSKPLELLNFAAVENTGVFYPLQTFSRNKRVDFREIPVFIEAGNNFTRSALFDIARSVTGKTFYADSEQRKGIHVAAVFACNLVNHLMRIAQDIIKKENLSFDLLKPLLIETVNKSLALGPDKAQTGPAVREDLQALDIHMEYLKFNKAYAEIYRAISQNIIDVKYGS